MTYALSISKKSTWLHVVVSGQNRREHIFQYLEEVVRECEVHHCQKVLLEERLKGPRFGTLDVFHIAAEGAELVVSKFLVFAYVDVYATDSTVQFAETVARNRGLHVRVFSTVAEAEAWLMSDEAR